MIPSLSTPYIRKCVLSSPKWYYLLLGNCHLLHNAVLEESRLEKEKGSAFHMNDDQNVMISNALGVVVLELGEKW